MHRGAALLLFGLGLLIAAEPRAQDGGQDAYAVQPLLEEIRARQAELDARERVIAERERAYEELLAIVRSQLAEITDVQDVVAARIEAWEQRGGERIGKLARIYAAMPAPAAARLVDQLDPSLATEILSKMKPKSSAAVLERVSRELALLVSEQVAYPLSTSPAKLGDQ